MVQYDFATLARQLIAKANRTPANGVAFLERAAPDVVQQIRRDARQRGPLSFWGRSENIDELADTIIVEPSVLHVIAAIAGRNVSTRTPHAGLQHTYGYLFSTIETEYGFKRDRWVKSSIGLAVGFDSTVLGPHPDQGTLLANATWLSGQIAFRGHRERLRRLRSFLSKKFHGELSKFDVTRFKHVRLLETARTSWRKKTRSWTLQTDIIESTMRPGRMLLVYSIVDNDKQTHELITLFPTTSDTRDALVDRAGTRKRSDIRIRYNAYVPALKGRVLSGSCRVKRF